MSELLTVHETAVLLGMSDNGVRVQLQRGLLPFGQAIPSVKGKEYRYLIPKRKVYEYLGIEVNENEKII